jgi:hypothetical protein
MMAESWNSLRIDASQQCGKQVVPAINKHAAIEEFLEVVVSVQPVPRLYNEDTIQIRTVMTYACPTWECDGHSPLEIAASAEQSTPRC